MGVFIRNDSPFYQLLLERAGEKPIRTPTKIRHDATDRQTRAENQRLAEREYHRQMQALAKGTFGEDDGYTKTFTELADWYQKHSLPKHRGADRERDILTHLREFFGATLLRSIKPAKVDEYETSRLREKAAPSTINREVDLLKTMLRIAAANGWCPPKLIYGKARLHAPKGAKARMTPEQEAAILAELDHPNDRALLIMGTDTLARMGDLLDFQKAHDHGTTADIVDPKNGHFLNVPISTRLRAALDACLPDPKNGPHVFWQRRQAVKPRDWLHSVRSMLRNACKRANVPYGRKRQAITFHAATRRTGATRMLARGADLATVQSIGGWKDLRSVQDYVIAEDENRQTAVELIGAVPRLSRRDRLKAIIK